MEWAPEFDVDEDLARRLIAAQFPDIALESITRFGAGMDNVAYLIDDRYVFRFPRRGWVAPLLEREERILPLIARHLPLAVPFPQFIGRPDLGYPWTFAGYERVDGTTACSAALTLEQRVAFARPLGTFLRALHSIPAEAGERAGLPGDEIGRLDHAARLPLARERFAQLTQTGALDDAAPFACCPHRLTRHSSTHMGNWTSKRGCSQSTARPIMQRWSPISACRYTTRRCETAALRVCGSFASRCSARNQRS